MGLDGKNILFSHPFKSYVLSDIGTVAEWLGSALQKLLQQFESARYLNLSCSPAGFFIYADNRRKRFYQVLGAKQVQEEKIPLAVFYRAADGRAGNSSVVCQHYLWLAQTGPNGTAKQQQFYDPYYCYRCHQYRYFHHHFFYPPQVGPA